MTEIRPDEADARYGISTDHEGMESGEMRFRLRSEEDGSAYIRTVGGSEDAWQNSHSHRDFDETYLGQSGWIAVAKSRGESVSIRIVEEGGSLYVPASVPHCVFVPAKAVFHCVKRGHAKESDWHAEESLDQAVRGLNAKQVQLLAAPDSGEAPRARKYDAYIEIYNNLDNLIWQIPGYLVAILALLFTFLGNSILKTLDRRWLPLTLAALLLFAAVLLSVGVYAMKRLRKHHTIMGEYLCEMEESGYFRKRRQTVRQKWPPSAPRVFMWIFMLFALLLLASGVFLLCFRVDWTPLVRAIANL